MVVRHTNTFSTWDYVVFALLLCISAGIGIWHALRGGRQKTAKEYLLANRGMGAIPVGMSVVATFMSAITVLGTPSEFYNFGTMFWWFGVAYMVSSLLSAYIYMPVFYRLQITSVFEYLERRFNRPVRLFALAVFQTQMIFYMGLAIYAPALALNEVTNFPLWGAVWACGLVCTFYCTIGGMKAVIWTDVLQLTVMVAGFLLLIIKGSIDQGGLSEVFRKVQQDGRIDFVHFELDPRVRHTFWSINIGGMLLWLSVFGVNQTQVQRYMSCRSLNQARGALIVNIIGMNVVLAGVALTGLVMYAKYSDCDPFSVGWVGARDQLVPYFLMDILGGYPGVPGLFVAAVFSGALSSISSGLNALVATLAEDVVKPFFNPPEATYTWITKIFAICYGFLCIGVAYLASVMGDVLIIALRLFGMIGGPLLGLFSLALFFPWCNSKGAGVGLLIGLVFSFWVGVGAIFGDPPRTPTLSLSIENCSYPETSHVTYTMSSQTPATSPVFSSSAPTLGSGETIEKTGLQIWWYGMSYLWYSAVGVAAVLISGLITSFITVPQDPEELEPGLISPIFDVVCCCFPAKWRQFLWCGVRHDIETTSTGDEEKLESHREEHDANPDYETKL